MIIFPAIDLREGRCVRLRQGDPSAETVFGEDPAAMAVHWASKGAEWLHVVNLDGALDANQKQIDVLQRPKSIRVQHPGQQSAAGSEDEIRSVLPINLVRLHQIRQAVDIPIQFGGGLRTLDDIELALELGADRVILGTVAVEQPQLVADAVSRWGSDRIVAGIDARDGMVATHGWQETSLLDAVEAGHRVHAMGVRHVVFTDIARDGMLSGVNMDLTTKIGDVTGLKVIASGGVANIADIERLKAHEHFNIEGVIVGQALYTGQLDLAQAIAIGQGPLHRVSAGIIPYRRLGDRIEYLLLYSIFCQAWHFPRGGTSRQDATQECALKKFHRETGLVAKALHSDFYSELHFTREIRDYSVERTIIYFLAETGPEDVKVDTDVHCEARWATYDEAWELLADTGPEQLPSLEQARQFIEQL